MSVHPRVAELESFSLGRLRSAKSLQVQRHLFNCPPCLGRLVEIERRLPQHQQRQAPVVNLRKPLVVVHDTVDGMVYSRAIRQGRKWLARHRGSQLDGGRECRTVREANEFLQVAFREMFPEHRCTERCRVNAEIIEPCGRWQSQRR